MSVFPIVLTTKKSVFPKNDIHKANGYNPGEFTKMLLTKLRRKRR